MSLTILVSLATTSQQLLRNWELRPPGNGKEICGVLDGLVDYVLEKRNHSYRRPVYLPDGYKDEADVDEDPQAAADPADEFKLPDYGDDNAEEAYMELTSLGSAGLRNRVDLCT
eukprot:gene25830-11506_t